MTDKTKHDVEAEYGMDTNDIAKLALRAVQRKIATDWQGLYKEICGVAA